MLRSLLTLALLMLAPLAALAHGMSMDVSMKDGEVTVELRYDDNTPGAGARVEVFNATKEVVMRGITDEQGKCSFLGLPPGEYSARAKTDDGHAARRSFTVSADSTPTPEVPGVTMSGPARWIALGVGLVLIAGAFTAFYYFIRRQEAKRTSQDEPPKQDNA